MKTAILLDPPLREAFSLLGVDYVLDSEEDIGSDVTLIITSKDNEDRIRKKFGKIVVGV